MRSRWTVIAVLLAVVALALMLAACGGDDEEATTGPAPRDGVETPRETTPPPDAPTQLPPEFLECMADQGFEIKSPADIHSAPPRVLQACFGSLHQGGGAP